MKAKRKTKEPIVIAVRSSPQGNETGYTATVVPGESIHVRYEYLIGTAHPTAKIAAADWSKVERGSEGGLRECWWVERLTCEQKCELSEIMQDTPEIVGDWVEDHGGERDWVKYVRLLTRYVRTKEVLEATYKVGDTAEYSSCNLSYMGTIVSITEKTVTIQPGDESKKYRLSLYTFCWRNADSVEGKLKRNAEWTD